MVAEVVVVVVVVLVVVQGDRRTGAGVGCHGDETW